MSNGSQAPKQPPAPARSNESDAVAKSDEMRHADTANGENPDADIDEPSPE